MINCAVLVKQVQVVFIHGDETISKCRKTNLLWLVLVKIMELFM